MRPTDDSLGEMLRIELERDDLDEMLAGAAPAQVSSLLRKVAPVIEAAGAPAAPDERAGLDEAVATAVRVAAMDAELRDLSTPRRAHVRTPVSRLKLAGVIAGTLVVSMGGLAAAGALPAPAQDAVARVFDRVGITIPASDPQGTSEQHPAATGEEISQLATTSGSEGVDKGAEISGLASGGISKAGAHPTGAADGTGGDAGGSTAEDGSDGASATGIGVAQGASAGHASDAPGLQAPRP